MPTGSKLNRTAAQRSHGSGNGADPAFQLGDVRDACFPYTAPRLTFNCQSAPTIAAMHKGNSIRRVSGASYLARLKLLEEAAMSFPPMDSSGVSVLGMEVGGDQTTLLE